jgi:hypothetical protein
VHFRGNTRLLRLAALAAWLARPVPVDAVLFFATEDPAHNTTAPAGELAASGWQFQGYWGDFLGTPIAANLFLTAKHIGGLPGHRFTFRGVEYVALDSFECPDADLTIWRVCGTFPEFAPLYTSADEAGRNLVVFGRGSQRGEAVLSSPGNVLKGWRWGTPDGVLRWGENVVSGTLTQPGSGNLLRARFDADGRPHEAHLSVGDSGGAVFIHDGTAWRLAGINHAVDGPYNTSPSGAGFQAAVFDEGGLYAGGEGSWLLVPDLPVDRPGSFYAVRVSSHLAWIQGIVDAHAGKYPATALSSAPDPAGPYQTESSAVFDGPARTVRINRPESTRFYRLHGCGAPRLVAIEIDGGHLVIHHE